MTPRTVLQAWLEAFDVGDAAKITDLYAERATNHQVAEEPVVGREAIGDMFAGEFATADMFCIAENVFVDGEWAILEWRDPQGLRGCGFFHVIGGEIVFQRGYWDKLSLQRLHGARPAAQQAG